MKFQNVHIAHDDEDKVALLPLNNDDLKKQDGK